MFFHKSAGAVILGMLLMLGLSGYKLAQPNATSQTEQASNSTNKPVKSSDQASDEHKQDINVIDLTDLDALTEKYFDSVFWGGITATSWNSPNELRPDYFIDFYIQKVLEKKPVKEREDYSVPALEFEKYIRQFFDVDPLLLQKAEQYDKQKNEYTKFGYLGGGASGKIVAAKCKNDKLILKYEYYSPADDVTVIRTGTLTVRILGDEYQYLSCKTRAMNDFEL